MSGIFAWSPFSRSQSNPSSDRDTIELRYGRETYPLSFKPGVLATLPISELKALGRQEAHIPDDLVIKLLFQGRRMNDGDVVGKHNVQHGSRVLMTTSKNIETPPTFIAQTTANLPSKTAAPQTPLDKIAAIRAGIKNTFGPQIMAFTRNPPHTVKERAETKARLNELLLQQLLKFDDVIIDPDDFGSREARLERKAAVKWVQGLMDEVDGVSLDGSQE